MLPAGVVVHCNSSTGRLRYKNQKKENLKRRHCCSHSGTDVSLGSEVDEHPLDRTEGSSGGTRVDRALTTSLSPICSPELCVVKTCDLLFFGRSRL